MTSQRDSERWILKRFLSIYDHESWREPFATYDWVEDRHEGAVEVIAARASDGKKLAIEHTLIQPYPQEKRDRAWFLEVFRDDDPALIRAGAFLFVNVPAGLLQPGGNGQLLAAAVYQCIRQNKSTIQEGYGSLACEIKGNATVRLQARLMECPGNPGRTWIGTYGPMDVETTVRTALRTKLPKLTKTAAELRLLILERDQIHLVPKYIVRAIDDYRAQFPQLQSVDEIWIAETHEDRRVVLFDRLRPDYSYVPCFIFDGDKVLRQVYD